MSMSATDASTGFDSAGLAVLRAQLERFWTRTLAAYKQAVEEQLKNKARSVA
jgi:hypothetical protein